MPIVRCKTCRAFFEARIAVLQRGWGKYCSSVCQYKSFRTGEYMKCTICKKESYKSRASLRHSKSGKYFCSKSCQTKWRNSQYVGTKHSGWKNGMTAYREILLRTGKPSYCNFCFNKDMRVLAVHHKDEDRTNNKLENLVWLCHNCHHLVHHNRVVEARFSEKIKMIR